MALVASLLLGLSLQGAAGGMAPAGTGDCVVLLHGLGRTSASMEPLQEFLEAHGYAVANVDYPSRKHPIQALAPLAVEKGIGECQQGNRPAAIHFVTHSLGGILVRYYFSRHEHDALGRVVMLAPPNQGSNAADAFRHLPGFAWLNGPAGFQLGKGEGSVPLALGTPAFEFAVIAGNRTIDPLGSAVLDNPDDGKVSVSDTRLAGMRDFTIVAASHAFIMQNEDVFRLVAGFLAEGRFDEE